MTDQHDLFYYGRLTNEHDVTVKPFHDDDSKAVITMAHRISQYLHNCVKQWPACEYGKPCTMCASASRLVLNEAIPLVAVEMIGLACKGWSWQPPTGARGSDD